MYVAGAIAVLLAIGSLYSIAKNPHKKRFHKAKNNTTRL
jgi:hypothetical protein